MADETLIDHLKDLFAPLGGVTFRKMFGGIGIFREGVMFALVSSQGVAYLKVDATNEAAFEAEGCEKFTVAMRGKEMSMDYRRIPERLFDEADEFLSWASDAYAVADRNRKPKNKPKKRQAAEA